MNVSIRYIYIYMYIFMGSWNCGYLWAHGIVGIWAFEFMDLLYCGFIGYNFLGLRVLGFYELMGLWVP